MKPFLCFHETCQVQIDDNANIVNLSVGADGGIVAYACPSCGQLHRITGHPIFDEDGFLLANFTGEDHRPQVYREQMPAATSLELVEWLISGMAGENADHDRLSRYYLYIRRIYGHSRDCVAQSDEECTCGLSRIPKDIKPV